jgi:hypothetical protein
MDDDKVVIKNVKVEYITTKTDAFDNEMCYFKLKDKHIESKFAAIMKDGFKLPWFKSDKGYFLLKVKSKYNKMKALNKEETVLVDVVFKYYKMKDSEGFYVSNLG